MKERDHAQRYLQDTLLRNRLIKRVPIMKSHK
ncbi:MAG TPA: hypothetical protein EYN80_07305 [Alphaproteobacteria bacterium]|nr:hypothetical protein [Alphaproteobacteria bacterium]HIA22217.1 hypothetical protein [Alphaproteobacteria bacterium]HIB19113.1 hypothetical protein [Alphaproteobacteria bacterium]HIB56554.1 hypothetical protein [Alphaproteobacteria bacterium]HIN92855.1 hypothetical protein [Alphaproteobacteria bacterium]